MKRLTSILTIFAIIILGGVAFAQNNTLSYLQSIARSDSGLYTAVGGSGFIITSDDGVSWSKISGGTTEKINGIIWAMGKFVAVGDKGTILTSSDGKDWSKADLNQNVDLYGVASSGNEIIATGYNGTVLVSKDGQAWEQTRMATAERIYRVRWINGRYIAVGDAMLILTSTDGVTWDEVNAEPSSAIMFTDVAWNGEKYVVVGDHLNVWVSKDGEAWAQDESILKEEGMDYTCCIYSVVWTGNKFVAVGQGGNIFSSADGSEWHREDYATGRALKDIIYSNGKFVAIGDEGIILSSEDGASWNNHSTISAQSTGVNLKLGEQKLLKISLNHPYGESEDITGETLFEVIDGADILSVEKGGTMKAVGVGQALVRATYDYKSLEVSVSIENDTAVEGEKNDRTNGKEDNNKLKDGTKLSDILLTAGAIIVVVGLALVLIKKRKS